MDEPPEPEFPWLPSLATETRVVVPRAGAAGAGSVAGCTACRFAPAPNPLPGMSTKVARIRMEIMGNSLVFMVQPPACVANPLDLTQPNELVLLSRKSAADSSRGDPVDRPGGLYGLTQLDSRPDAGRPTGG